MLVVGAPAGLGRATAVAAVRDGAKVVLSARRAAALDGAVASPGVALEEMVPRSPSPVAGST